MPHTAERNERHTKREKEAGGLVPNTMQLGIDLLEQEYIIYTPPLLREKDAQ